MSSFTSITCIQTYYKKLKFIKLTHASTDCIYDTTHIGEKVSKHNRNLPVEVQRDFSWLVFDYFT